MDTAAVFHADPVVSSEPKVIKQFPRWEFDEEKYYEEQERKSYYPLSFYTSSTVYSPDPITVNKSLQSKLLNTNYIPLSLFTDGSTAYRRRQMKASKNYITGSSESKMVTNEKEVSKIPLMVSRNYISDDIAFYVLSKLPIKSLKRFQCVSKSWSVLFENPDFMTLHSNHFISRHGSDDDYRTFLLTLTPAPGLYNCEFYLLGNPLKLNLPSPFQRPCSFVSILGSTSVNGIFCFGHNNPAQNQVQYVLWNPATEESWDIPSSFNESKPHYPLNNFYLNHGFHGFGYDQVRDDFMLIQLVSLDLDRLPSWQSQIYFEIYSLKTNSWRWINMNGRIDLDHWMYTGSFDGHEVYVDGTCHWLFTKDVGKEQHTVVTLLSFDLSNEAFITTPIGEESITPHTYNRRLAVLNGSIALLSNYDDNIVFHISILGQLGVTESWTKLYICGPLPSLKWPPYGFGKMGYMFFEKTDGELAYVDLSTKKIEEVDMTTRSACLFTVGLYKKSLLSIRGSSK